MNDGVIWWLLIVGLAIGVGLAWLLLVRLPRADDDLGADERRQEADWISRTIEGRGGVAPPELVDEVLGLHTTYLESPGLARPTAPATPVEAEESTVDVPSGPSASA